MSLYSQLTYWLLFLLYSTPSRSASCDPADFPGFPGCCDAINGVDENLGIGMCCYDVGVACGMDCVCAASCGNSEEAGHNRHRECNAGIGSGLGGGRCEEPDHTWVCCCSAPVDEDDEAWEEDDTWEGGYVTGCRRHGTHPLDFDFCPTVAPTVDPTTDPTIDPTIDPTTDPTVDPSDAPSSAPSLAPSLAPSAAPTASCTPVVEIFVNDDCTDELFDAAQDTDVSYRLTLLTEVDMDALLAEEGLEDCSTDFEDQNDLVAVILTHDCTTEQEPANNALLDDGEGDKNELGTQDVDGVVICTDCWIGYIISYIIGVICSVIFIIAGLYYKQWRNKVLGEVNVENVTNIAVEMQINETKEETGKAQ